MKSKYMKKEVGSLQFQKSNSSYFLRRQIKKVWPTLLDCTKWTIKKGTTARFWIDPWVDLEGPLLARAITEVPETEFNKKVGNYASVAGNWNWESFSHFFLVDTVLKIASIPPPAVEKKDDCISWAVSNDKNFSLKSACTSLVENDWNEPNYLWKLIWKWKGPERIKSYLWLLGHRDCPKTISML